jgi:hypothetical protein
MPTVSKEESKKYGFCLSGSLTYSRQLPGEPFESYPEFNLMNHVRTDDSVGRPFRHRLPQRQRKKRHRS